MQHQNIAIFASGSGSNAEKIIQHFSSHPLIRVGLIICNRKQAGVWDIAKHNNIPCHYFPKSELYESNAIVNILKEQNVSWIVLAGFLLKIPETILESYPNNIINIHPALLPKFGGKGMYGMHVHNAVVENKETESGITIHLVNENYDEGEVISQHACEVTAADNAEEVRDKVQQLEHKHFAKDVEAFILKNKNLEL